MRTLAGNMLCTGAAAVIASLTVLTALESRLPTYSAEIILHTCPNNGCPLDDKGCHRDERGRYHCH